MLEEAPILWWHVLGILPSHSLTLPQHVSSAYKDWWFKVTINELMINIFLLEKSIEANSSKCEKDEETSSSDIYLVNKKPGLSHFGISTFVNTY